MSCMTRGILRWGLIGGLALGAVTVLVGPDRVAAGLSQLQWEKQRERMELEKKERREGTEARRHGGTKQ